MLNLPRLGLLMFDAFSNSSDSDFGDPGHGRDGSQPRCPLGRDCQLRILNSKEMFAECVGDESRLCPQAMNFGGGYFCRQIWTISRSGAG